MILSPLCVNLAVLLLFLSELPLLFASPVDTSWHRVDPVRGLTIREAVFNSQALPSTHDGLSKRTLASALPDGWWFLVSHEEHFNYIHTAVSRIVRYYSAMLTTMTLPQNSALQSPDIVLQDGPFELSFRVHDRLKYPDFTIPPWLVRAFIKLMLQRAQRGLAVQYSGYLRRDDGMSIGVTLRTVGVVVNVLDSASDIMEYMHS
ncbi:MAG: hypothetical protein Q9174_005780 [Haloplaca sp. 1 TL-2023]